MTGAWHTSDYPELRPRPPWVMEEMVEAQATLPAGFSGQAEAGAVSEAVSRALRAGEAVHVVGCGTSEHAALAITALLREAFDTAPAGRITARQALDAALDPPSTGLVLGISHDGGTRATMLALAEARRNGARTAAITARADSEVAAAADLVLVTPALDRSWCHTLAYTSAILGGAAIAGAGRGEGWIAASDAVVAACLRDGRARQAGARLYPTGRVVTAGLGTDLIAARELALKLEEGARIAATAHQLETLLHGHLAGCDADSTRVVLFATHPGPDRRLRRRLELVCRAVGAIGIPTIVITRSDTGVAFPAADVIKLTPAQAPAGEHALLGALLGAAVTLQRLTLGLVDSAGTNPDLIRREQASYRAAAQVADEAADW